MKKIRAGPLTTSVEKTRLFTPEGRIHLLAVSSLLSWSHRSKADVVMFCATGNLCKGNKAQHSDRTEQLEMDIVFWFIDFLTCGFISASSKVARRSPDSSVFLFSFDVRTFVAFIALM